MKLDLFFATHPVFTIKEIKSFLGSSKSTSTLSNLLQYHKKMGHIILIRRGIYAVVPKEMQGTVIVDPYLIASKLKGDSVLAYQTALALHEKSHTMVNHLYYLTKARPKNNFEFQGNIYQAVSIPSNLQKSNIGIIQINRMDLVISLTSLERTFVDILDRPYLCLSWEEIFRSIDNIEYVDSEAVLRYVFMLGKRTTAAIVGFFLDLYKEKWMIPMEQLEELKKFWPNKPFYLQRSIKSSQKLISSWNLIVPQIILEKSWEEPHEDI